MNFKWFFDYQKDQNDKIFDRNISYLYIKQPRNMSFDQVYLKQMYQTMIKNNGISLKEIDKILLKSTNCFSLLFHNNLNKNKILFFQNYLKFKEQIKKQIINICQKKINKNFGKCSIKNYSKIKTILNQYDLCKILCLNQLDIRMIGFLFSKKQIKQTKLLINNCYFKNIDYIKKFPKLFFKHTSNNFSKLQLYLIIAIILSQFNSIKYINYKQEFLKFQKLLKSGMIFYYQWNENQYSWKGKHFI